MRRTINVLGIVAMLFLVFQIQTSLRTDSAFAAGPRAASGSTGATGPVNKAIGYRADRAITSGHDNVAIGIAASVANYRKLPNGVLLPDKSVTPGENDPALTVEKLCDPKFRTATARNAKGTGMTEAIKKQVYLLYGQAPHVGICKDEVWKNPKTGETETLAGCEVDHLRSVELGGANSAKNTWPQPYNRHSGPPGAMQKDIVENAAHKYVCDPSAPASQRAARLEDMRTAISDNWYALGQRLKVIK